MLSRFGLELIGCFNVRNKSHVDITDVFLPEIGAQLGFSAQTLQWVVSAYAVAFGGFLLLMRVIHGAEWAVQGVFTLFAILFVFVGAQFIGMGLLGEYLGRVYKDVRARPRYLVHEVKGRSHLTPA